MGFFYGLTFFKLQLNQEGIQNINGVIFLSVLYISVIYLFGTVKVSIFLTHEHVSCCYNILICVDFSR